MSNAKFDAVVDFLGLREIKSTASGNNRLLPVDDAGKVAMWKIFQNPTKTQVYYELLKMIAAGGTEYKLVQGEVASNIFIEREHKALAMLGITIESIALPSYEEFVVSAKERAAEVQAGIANRFETRQHSNGDSNGVKGWAKPVY